MPDGPALHTTVLYHAHCPDGFAAALACWEHFGDQAQYLPVSYGQPLPDIPQDHCVYIVDFSYPKEIILSLLSARLSLGTSREPYVVVLDHHASAQRDLASLRGGEYRGLEVLFDMEESGATLTWKYLHGVGGHPGNDPEKEGLERSLPLFYKYIRDRDLWRWELDNSREISMALFAEPQDFQEWADIKERMRTAMGLSERTLQGKAIRQYAEKLILEQASRATVGRIGGYAVPIVNATTLFSEVGDFLCTTQPDISFCAYYFDRNDGKRQWGLRGHGKVDLSAVAKGYGGGGHPNAAGFVTGQGWRGDTQP